MSITARTIGVDGKLFLSGQKPGREEQAGTKGQVRLLIFFIISIMF